ncbi:acetyl/propionyl/methylcrotonyl-CoA carboxylase subunit alpha [Brevundimonas poindexterae]|uniref:acetyl/propionyl/methylcrotonyl-CoA carboxylase subunit alpha n=1 Tax=Brevundimonas poindexterae TaxID=74325 RepID=UPI001CFE346A|nr:acetyl/propionyl/methylcrotonyl-CoA carboxylase subunit alpha [Brevundimonas poindexterae]
MFKSVLVANRGEIACRVFRTARAMGLRTIAVYSEADARAPHVQMADEAVLLGPAQASESYLDGAKVLAAARATGAEAIHPGYGFLSENADFAEAVKAAGLVWIGPPPASIRAMGLKDAAKKLMIEAGVPVTPGYQGEDQSADTLKAEADRIGYPVLIKAVAGGGGKGMRRVDRAEDFADALASAQREGQSSFGDPRVLIETYITRPRHIEVQVFGDTHGTVVHLNERDCSLQRRHQKVIEEAPAPGMDTATREAVTAAAVRAAKAVNYEGAGTIEFIADASEGLKADRIWFMEMNTRLQVEHPVTEAITGVDLVEWQLRVAAGEPIPLKQDEIGIHGWAMEARLYAEDPENGFLPSVGALEHFVLPPADMGTGDPEDIDDPADGPLLRVDTGVEEGGEVSQFYDPMIAKLIVHAETREAAADHLAGVCREVEVWPVRTNAAFLARCLDHPRFVAGDVDTAFIAAEEDTLLAPWTLDDDGALAAAVALTHEARKRALAEESAETPWATAPELVGFRLNRPATLAVPLRAGGEARVVELTPDGRDGYAGDLDGEAVPVQPWPGSGPHESWYRTSVTLSPDRAPVSYRYLADDHAAVLFRDGRAWRVDGRPAAAAGAAEAGDGALRAPMPGKVVAVPVKAGDTVGKGQAVIVIEAMKMEQALTAPFDGVVESVAYSVGDQVGADAVLAVVTAKD